MKKIVVMPGGFHPFHAGHLALYQAAQQAFPDAEVFVAATNDTSTRPFPFAVKEKLAQLAGVDPRHFVQVKSPFAVKEITQNFDPDNTQLIFVRSEKDRNKPPQAGGVKKNGEPAYLQPLDDEGLPMSQRAYMTYLPTVEFGPGITSATEIRTAWPTLNDKRKTAMVMSLYPKTQTNPKLAQTVVKMLDTAIGNELNEFVDTTGHYTGGSNPPPPPANPKRRDPFEDDPRSQLLYKIQQLLDAGKSVFVSIPGARGRAVGTNLKNDISWLYVRYRDFLKPKSRSRSILTVPIHSDNDNDLVLSPGPRDRFIQSTGEPFDYILTARSGFTGHDFFNESENSDYLEEKWSEKYKRSINCSNPRGFSQRAHCAGRKKKVSESSGYSLKGSFTRDLIASKVWLIEELARIAPTLETIYVLGSWYGNLSLYLNLLKDIKFNNIINVETNKQMLDQSRRMLDHLGIDNVESMLVDANELDYRQLGPAGAVINTSLTDMAGTEWFRHIPEGTMVVMQARDHDPGYQFSSPEDILEKFPLSRVDYMGTRELKDPETRYHRFMVIGRK